MVHVWFIDLTWYFAILTVINNIIEITNFLKKSKRGCPDVMRKLSFLKYRLTVNYKPIGCMSQKKI